MFIFGPSDLRDEVANEFRTHRVPFDPWMLASRSAEAGSVQALMVTLGSATALAATALVSWLRSRRGKRTVTLLFVDASGKREQVVVENPDDRDLPLLIAQAREVMLAKRTWQRACPNRKRIKLPARLRTKLIDEVRSTCPNPDCGKAGVTNLEAHHIDGDRSRTTEENLLMLCANCHGQADLQLINRDLVAYWKKLLGMGQHPFLDDPQRAKTPRTAPIVEGVNNAQAAETINNYHGVKPPRPQAVPGTIEADPPRRAYVYYLGQRYIEWRVKGQAEVGDRRPFNPKAAWNVIRRHLKFAPYKAGVDSFPRVVTKMTAMIDRTPFGCRNRAMGYPNYHSFEEHCKSMGL